MDFPTAAMFIAGFFLLVVGAEVLVRGASRLAVAVGITPLIVGQTVVAYGTSAPELAVTIQSSVNGQPDIAIGNVIGSNISNILLVLGVSALIRPLVVSKQLVRSSVPVMIIVSIAVIALGWDGVITRREGLGLLISAVLYSCYCIFQSRREHHEVLAQSEFVDETKLSLKTALPQLAMVVAGIACLVLGATWLVNGAVKIAELFGVSQLVIGLTIVAIGTSLPEIATSILAGARGQADIALGNAVGSNIFNILLVLGACAAASPSGVPVSDAAMRFDIPVMIAVAAACLPIFFTGMIITRWEGLLFLAYYGAYVMYLLLQAAEHDALGPYSQILFGYLAPITLATLLMLTLFAWRKQRREG